MLPLVIERIISALKLTRSQLARKRVVNVVLYLQVVRQLLKMQVNVIVSIVS